MGKITVETCHIEGLKVITPTVFGDERGYFMETYNYNDYKAAGIDMEFVQDNQSSSRKGVLRGLHFQINYPQDKLVRVVSGEVFDVAVDLREGSETYGQCTVLFCLLRIRNSSSFRRILHTDLLYFLIQQSSHTNVQTSIIRMMRVDLHTMILTSAYSGRSRRIWN